GLVHPVRQSRQVLEEEGIEVVGLRARGVAGQNIGECESLQITKPRWTRPTASSAKCASASTSQVDSKLVTAGFSKRLPALIMCWNSCAIVPRVPCRTELVDRTFPNRPVGSGESR